MQKRTYLFAALYALIGVALVTLASSAYVAHQSKALVGASEPVDVNAYNFKGNPDGGYAGESWDPAGDNTEKALLHQGIVVFYQYVKDGYGSYYMTANVGSNHQDYSGVPSNSVVHCPDGATIEGSHNSHHAYSPNIYGMYDGPGHYWCSSGGVAVNPLPGPESGKELPDMHNTFPLLQFTMPDGTNYYKDTNSQWAQCDSYAGPYDEADVGTAYHVSAMKGKNVHFHCAGPGNNYFMEPTYGSFSPPSPYDSGSYSYSSSSCPTGDTTCGGAGTYGTGSCGLGTYFCQTTDTSVRYCSDTPCAAMHFVPPVPAGPEWTLQNPSEVSPHSANGGETEFLTTEVFHFDAKFNANGEVPYPVWVSSTTKVSTTTGDFSNPVWTNSTHGTVNSFHESHGGVYSGGGELPIGGPYYFCIEHAAMNDGSQTSDGMTFEKTTDCITDNSAFYIVEPPANTCGDGVCDSTENSGDCPADCLATDTCGDGLCGSSESSSSCASDCGTSEVCGNGTCGSGETAASCPSDCGTTDATHPVATTATQTTTTTATTTSTTTTSNTTTNNPVECAIGSTCPSGSWCNNGRQCYSPDGSLTCSRWEQPCSSGTFYCSPNENNCIEPGEYGNADGWCKDSMECFMDGRKFCQPMSYGPMPEPATCPAGAELCSPNDPNCIEPGDTGSVDGWCQQSMECYSKDGGEKYCQEWDQNMTAATMAPALCPATYPNYCRPNDTNCIEPGSKGDEDGWCGGPSKVCFTSSGLYCALEGESCPSGSSACRENDRGCVEPGEYGDVNGWCGGRDVAPCYKDDGSKMYCAEFDHEGPWSWETASCPSGSSRCRPDDRYCLELGETGPSSSWCAVGMNKWNSDDTVTCVSSSDYATTPMPVTEPELKPEICIQVAVTKQNSSTGECRMFSTPCKVPEGWTDLESDQICKNGEIKKSDTLTDSKISILDALEMDRQHLKDIKFQLKRVPESVSGVGKIFTLIEEGFEKIDEIKALVKRSYTRKKASIKESYSLLHKNIIDDVDNRMADVESYIEYSFWKDGLKKDLITYKRELDKADILSEFYRNLNGAVERLEDLMDSAETQRGEGLERLLGAIERTHSEIEKLLQGSHDEKKENFLGDTLENLKAASDEFAEIANRDEGYLTRHDLFMIDRLSGMVKDLSSLYKDGRDKHEFRSLLDEAFELRDRLAMNLGMFTTVHTEQVDMESTLLSHLDEEFINDIMEKVLNKVADKLTVMLDEALQKAAVQIVEIVSVPAEKLSQSLSNLTSVIDEHRTAIVETKNVILEKVNRMETLMAEKKLQTSLSSKLKGIMELSSTVNWCGINGETMQSKINSAVLALEAEELTLADVTKLHSEISSLAEENNEACYVVGASNFKDTPMHLWYFESAQFNSNSGYINGYSDDKGNSTGEFGPADATLRIEALAMGMRMFGIPFGESGALKNSMYKGVPEWGIPYINGALAAGYDIDSGLDWSQPITRAESAKLFAALGRDHITIPSAIAFADDYEDYSSFSTDRSTAQAIDALTEIEVFQGYEGNFNPHNQLLRSEFATVNMRLVNTLGLE
jgi:hypothetical protein